MDCTNVGAQHTCILCCLPPCMTCHDALFASSLQELRDKLSNPQLNISMENHM